MPNFKHLRSHNFRKVLIHSINKVLTSILFSDQLIHYTLQQQNPEVDAKSKEIKLKKATLQKQQHELQVCLPATFSYN